VRRHDLILALAVAAMGGMASASPRVGGAAPAITAKTLDGSAFDLASLRGRVVVINVWATWCTPCRAEMPALNAVYGELHGRGLEMIGLSADKPRDKAKVRQIMAAFSYPAATADQTHDGGLTDTSSLPVTYVVDKTGTIRAVLRRGPPLTVTSLGEIVAPLMDKVPG
jgi:peroxiredoxin